MSAPPASWPAPEVLDREVCSDMVDGTEGATPPSPVGQRVREIREWRDVSLRAVAELAGFSPAYLSLIETGKRPVEKRSTIEALARALRVSPTELGSPSYSATDPDVVSALDGLVGVEAALTDVALGEDTVVPRPWEAIAADVAHVNTVLRPRPDVPALTALLPQLIRELNAILARGPANRDEVLDALIHVLHATTVAARHSGARSTPGLAALRMREVADELDQPRYDGLARYARAQTLGSRGRLRMQQLSMSAADDLSGHLADEAARQVYVMLHLNVALAAAARDDADTSRSHIREAREVVDSAPDPVGTGWAGLSANRTNVVFWEAALALELGEPDRVPVLAETIAPELMTSWSRQAAFYADLGRSLARSKATRADAVEALVRAESLAPVTVRTNLWARETVADLLRPTNRDAPADRNLRGLAYRMGFAA